MRQSATDQMLLRHEQALRAMAAVMAENNRLLRATMPQFYTVKQLSDRWALSREAVKALLHAHGIRGSVGRCTRVHVDHVLQIDVELEASK